VNQLAKAAFIAAVGEDPCERRFFDAALSAKAVAELKCRGEKKLSADDARGIGDGVDVFEALRTDRQARELVKGSVAEATSGGEKGREQTACGSAKQ
jgi:hypothetical protein